MEVVDGGQEQGGQLLGFEEVVEVGQAVVGAGVAGAGGVDRGKSDSVDRFFDF